MLNLLQGPPGRVLSQSPGRVLIAPHPLLRTCVAHYTVTTAEQQVESETLSLVPDASGCMVFTWEGGDLQGCYWGATTRTVVVQNDTPQVKLRLFVEFLPGGSFQLTGLPQNELTDSRLSMEEFQRPVLQAVEEALFGAQSLWELTERLDDVLLSLYLRCRSDDPVPVMLEFLNGGNASVRRLAEESCYSERHLNRLFHRSLGMNVKTYARMLRVNRALGAMQEGESSLTRVALQQGYYDQAHFIHDFKAVCGVPPGVYLQNLSVFYKEDYKF